MSAWRIVRRSLGWAAAALLGLMVLALGLIGLLDAGFGRGVLIEGFAWRMARPIQVHGALSTHLLSLHPQVRAEDVTIGNPRWMPLGVTAQIGSIWLEIKLPGFGHPAGIVALDAKRATLRLARDATGRANWQLTDPAHPRPHTNSPILRSLRMPGAHVLLDDAQRHLQFDGTVSASNEGGPLATQPVRVDGQGQLNGRPVTFLLMGDAPGAASHRKPYHFTFTERSGDSHLEARGVLPQPFAFDIADATFESAGADLKDLHFLTGVQLIDTGAYRLSGAVSRRGRLTRFSELRARTGDSDMAGTLSIDSTGARPKFAVDLRSRLLKLSDLGLRAAGRDPSPRSPLLLSDARISNKVLRMGEATVEYHADRVDVGRVPVEAVSAQGTINQGVLTVASLLGGTLGGRIAAHGSLDARQDLPAAAVDLKVTGMQLARLAHKHPDQPAAQGSLSARISITGTGSSVHQVAATANGTVKVEVPSGVVRRSLAELSGIDWRGLGLLLTKSEQEVPLRCAVADFRAQDGTLTTENLIVDTGPVLISGEGRIQLQTEAVELMLNGHPKHVRFFRIRAPVLVEGTLAHPALRIQARGASLKIIDPGHARDADCSALLSASASTPSSPR